MRGNHATPMATSGAILAGGQARRFAGRDKSSLLIDGRTILARQLEALGSVAETIVIVGAASVPAGGAAACTLPDLVPGAGPLGGLYSALVATPASQVIVVACDMPFVTSGLLRTLATACEGHDAAVPFAGGRWHPLCACYSTRCAPRVRRQLDDGRLRMTDLLAMLDVATLDEGALRLHGDPARLLANVNTHEDYERLTR